MKKIIASGLIIATLICGNYINSLAETQDYQEILDYLETGNYDAAISYIQDLKAKSGHVLPEDLSEYLLEVELTADNFDEYFEWKVVHPKNAFGEEDKNITYGDFASKMFDQGYYLYDMDEIPIEFQIGDWDSSTWTLDSNNFGGRLQSGPNMPAECKIIRIGNGRVVFVKKEVVTVVEYDASPEGRHDIEVVINHGEEEERIWRSYLEGFEY